MFQQETDAWVAAGQEVRMYELLDEMQEWTDVGPGTLN